MTELEREIYEYSHEILDMGKDSFNNAFPYQFEHTERCIEVPWLASRLNKFKIGSLLDIGFTFASHDYLRMILDWGRAKGHKLYGTDIINPEKVQSRYPKEWWEEINEIHVIINDISKCAIKNEEYDAVSLISTMEHIGFDKPSVTVSKSAFERSKVADEVIRVRSVDTEKSVLDNVAAMLREGGYCFISVPSGKGGPMLIKDSMDLYGCYWEYEENSWKNIVEHSKFSCLEQRFFIEDNKKWKEVDSILDLKNVTANMKCYASGLSVAVLKKRITEGENE